MGLEVLVMGASLRPLLLSSDDKLELEKLRRARSTPVTLAMRAEMILLASAGHSNADIARRLRCRAHVVGKWRSRFVQEGIGALADLARSGRPVTISLRDTQRVVMTACARPCKGLSRWSVRTLARHLGMPQARVQRILKAKDLHPHQLRTFTFSPDPQFEEKLLEVVGLYMHPPQNAVVLCVDEKTGIQALDRTQPILPLRAKKPRSWTNEYVRHGTRTVLASLEIKTGQVLARVKQTRTSSDFLGFMDEIVAAYPSQRLCIVLDNLNTHKNEAARQWLAGHPKVTFHYTPTHASWMNLIECFFSILTRQGLQQAVHKSGKELERFLKAYFAEYNKHCQPFVWTKGPEKLQRIIELTRAYQSQKNAANL
jgi:transposase